MYYTEIDAAHEFEIDPDDHILKPRASRIRNIAFIVAKRALHSMSDYDNHPPKKGKK